MNYDEFVNLARSRRSVRKFLDKPVSREDLQRIFEAARWAPSNHNRQPWKFIVLEDRESIARLSAAVGAGVGGKLESLPPVASEYAAEFAHYATFFSAAPVLITVLHKLPAAFSGALLKGLEHSELISGEPLSAAMAVQNVLLAAHSLGLGACVLTAPLIVREVVLGQVTPPPGYNLTCLIALGHPGEDPPQPRRKSIEQIAEFRNDNELRSK